MSENPSTGATTGTTGTTTPVPDSGTTGNPADAAPVQANPTDSSGVSDSEGVRSDEDTEQVDHEGTGPGDLNNLPDSDADPVEDGVEKETASDEQDS